MAKQILIPLRGNDRIEQVLPHIDRLAHAGTKVVFVVHYGLRGFHELMGQLLAIDKEVRFKGVSTTCDPKPFISSASQRIRRGLEGLVDRGIVIDTILYGCKLGVVLENYQGQLDVDVFAPDTGYDESVMHDLNPAQKPFTDTRTKSRPAPACV